jgi:hypothetical protein
MDNYGTRSTIVHLLSEPQHELDELDDDDELDAEEEFKTNELKKRQVLLGRTGTLLRNV